MHRKVASSTLDSEETSLTNMLPNIIRPVPQGDDAYIVSDVMLLYVKLKGSMDMSRTTRRSYVGL